MPSRWGAARSRVTCREGCHAGVKSWGLTAALIVGLGGAVGTAEASDDDGKTPAPKGLLSGLFAGKPKPQDKAALKPDEANPEPPNVADNTTLERHKNALNAPHGSMRSSSRSGTRYRQ